MKLSKLLIATTLLSGCLVTQITTEATEVTENTPKIGSRAIIGSDDRQLVTNTNQTPYQSVVFIEDGQGYIASGFYIGDGLVLTNGHVANKAYDANQPEKMKIYPGRGVNGSSKNNPFGSFKVKAIHIPSTYLDNSYRVENDYAVLELDNNALGQSIDTMVVPSKMNYQGGQTGQQVLLAGYPGDKGETMWKSSGQIVTTKQKVLTYSNDTVGGSSGSPILNTKNEVIGMHAAGEDAYSNTGLFFHPEMIDYIDQYRSEKETDKQAPTSLTLTNIKEDSMTLSFTEPKEQQDIQGYVIYRDNQKIQTIKNTTFSDKLLKAETTYSYQVSTLYKDGTESEKSLEVSGKTLATKDKEAPTTPKGLKSSNVTTTSVTLSWEASKDNKKVQFYNVYRNGVKIASPKTLTLTETTLASDTSYDYQISAVDDSGNESTLSAKHTVKTLKEEISNGQDTWQKEKTYNAKDTVVYQGTTYEAQWWTKGNVPTDGGVWKSLDTSKVSEWLNTGTYVAGDKVSYQGDSYQAKWWTKGNVPTAGGPWEKL